GAPRNARDRDRVGQRDRAGDRRGVGAGGRRRGGDLPDRPGGGRGDGAAGRGSGAAGSRRGSGRWDAGGGGGAVRGGRRRVRRGRYLGQQRRARRRRVDPRNRLRGLGAGDPDQPSRSVPLRPAGGAADDRPGDGGADRQHLLGPRGSLHRRLRRLLRLQGGTAQPHPNPCVGARGTRDHGQRDRARHDPDPAQPARPRRSRLPGRGRSTDSAQTRRSSRRYRPHGGLSVLGGGELLHRQHVFRGRGMDADVAAGL
ncbi:MAG: 3-oxoacyl-[acyl-carrier protein] reductase, partial [uncultured Thermomicrobiales bacterium]